MLTLHSFDGHPETRNILRKDIDYNTHVDLTKNECVLMTAHAKLSQVSKHIGNMSVKSLSDYDQYGNKENNPKWPFMMRLVPNDPCNMPDAFDARRPYWEHLTKGCAKEGWKLFDVLALEKPEELGGVEQHIGDIVLTSKMITSTWGDTKLFFRHVRFEEDLSEHPEWRIGIEEFERPTFVENLPLPS